MLDNFDVWPLAVVVAFVAGSAAHRRLIRAAQPLRLLLAEKGERLLVHPKLPKDMRDVVGFMMGKAFNNRMALLLGFLIIPAIAASMVFRPSSVASNIRQLSNADPEVQALFSEVMRLHDRITLANHPMLLILIEFEILVFVSMGILFFALVQGKVPANGDRDTMINLIEAREARFWMKSHMAT